MTEQSAEEIIAEKLHNLAYAADPEDIADYLVAALRSARLLLPEGAEVEIEYGRRHPESTVVLPTSRFYALHPASLMAAMQRSVWHGPWLPVEEETK